MPGRRRSRATARGKLDATPPWESRARDEPTPTSGPWDERDAPTDDVTRVDLGALRVPVSPGMDLRLEMNEAQQVIAANLAGRDGHMQLGVFAAPRNEGIWDEVRAEIVASMNAQRGTPRERADGPFGAEVQGKLPDPGGAMVPVRFIGVDGPRWFLRAMIVGAAATDPGKGERFERALRDVVVVRGNEPYPAREPVALRLPKEILDQQGTQQQTSG